MMKLLAGAFTGFAALFGGLFGAHHAPANTASSTPPMGQHMGSTSPMGMGHMGSSTPWREGSSTMMRMGMPGVMGTVTAVDGTSLTVEGRAIGPNEQGSATTTYSVDASSAKVMKSGDSSATVSSIQSGDHVFVSGTVSGTSVTAKMIMDGMPQMMMHNGMKPQGGSQQGSAPAAQ